MKKCFLALMLSLLFCNVYAQYSGIVYHDANGNGVQDKNEKGLINAVVSNGFQVVKTNQSGRFTLPFWEKARFITLYTSQNQISDHYFVPIKKQKQTYTFAVKLVPKKEKVSLVQISDTETFEHGDWLENIKAYSAIESPDFIVHTGDICYKSGMKWHAQEVNAKKLGVPIYYCLGNHDLIEGSYGEQYFEEKFGPAWYAFQKGNALFVITPMMGGDYKPSFTQEEIGGWLQNLLNAYPKNMPKYFFNHDILSNGEQFEFKINDTKSISLNDYNLKAWVFGHLHCNYTKTLEKSNIKSYGTSTTAKGGIDHSPSSFRVIDVDKEGNSKSHLTWTNVDDAVQIVSPNEHTVRKTESGLIPISVNAYSSNAKVDSIKYTMYDVAKRAWDVAVTDEVMEHLQPQSDWNWTAKFKPAANVLEYRMVLNVYFKNGRIVKKQHYFSIKASAEKSIDLTADWSNLAGNPEHDAVSKFKHTPEYELKWVSNIGSNIFMSSPVIRNNYVYTASFDDGNGTNNHIACYNTHDGKEVWKFRTKNGIKNQIVLSNQHIIGTDSQGITYALDLETGKLKWEKDLNYKRAPGFVSGLVTDGAVVYTGFGKSLEAIDAQTGVTIWRNMDWDGGMGSTPTMTIAGDVLIASANWGALYAHDIKTGKLVWKRSDNGLRFRNGNVLYKDNSLWVSENLEGKAGALHQLDVKTGKTVKTMTVPLQTRATTTPIITKDKVYIAGSESGIASFKRDNGERIWNFDVLPAIFYTPQYYENEEQSIETTPILINDALLFGAMDGWIYNLDANSGKVLWKNYVGAPILTSAAVTAAGFYICDFAGNLYHFVNK